MQHNTAFSVVNVSKRVPEWTMQAEGSLFTLEPERYLSQWYRASFADHASEKREFHLVEEIQENRTKQTLQLTVPVVPNERWFICCVRGPIMFAGCIDIGWSIVGVITAP